MNIIIAGDGEVGVYLAKSLSERDYNITVVDPHAEMLSRLENETDLMTVAGSATSPQVLKDAGVGECDLFLAVLHDESVNLMSCILAKKLKAKKTVARITNVELLVPKLRDMLRDLGVDEMACPERIAAKEITNLLNNSAAAEFFDFSGGLLTMYVIRLEAGSPVVDHAVKDLVETYKDLQVKVVALLRGGETIIPHGDTVFHAGDMAYIIGRANQVETINRVAGKEAVNIKKVMIAGGGRIGRYAASSLQERLKITLFEENRQRAEALSAELADTLVINGDATNIELLKEEGLQDVDAFIGVTNSSETNVLTCLHAKRLGVKRTIALVDNTGFINISQDIGIDTIINRKLITASYIARFIVKGDAVSSKWLSGTNAEVLELVVGKWAPATRKPIGQLEIPHGATVGGIIRGRETLLPNRDMQLKHGDKNEKIVVRANPKPADKVVLFSLPSAMADMVKLFD